MGVLVLILACESVVNCRILPPLSTQWPERKRASAPECAYPLGRIWRFTTCRCKGALILHPMSHLHEYPDTNLERLLHRVYDRPLINTRGSITWYQLINQRDRWNFSFNFVFIPQLVFVLANVINNLHEIGDILKSTISLFEE